MGVCKTRDEIDQVFAAIASPACASISGPQNYQAEKALYDMTFSDLINNRGIPINYYINTYNTEEADNLYGEHPTAAFYGPIPLMMYVELDEDSISFTNVGIVSDDSITAYVHIDTFKDTMSGINFNIISNNNTSMSSYDIHDLLFYDKPHINNNQAIEPKTGDLIEIEILGCDRPGNRGSKIFEITEETEQDMSALNPMLGHYIWRLRGKRYEHSFEPGMPGGIVTKGPQEAGNDQVYDNAFHGVSGQDVPPVPITTEDSQLILTEEDDDYIITEGGDKYTSPDKTYGDDIDEKSKDIFDMSKSGDVYGDYY